MKIFNLEAKNKEYSDENVQLRKTISEMKKEIEVMKFEGVNNPQKSLDLMQQEIKDIFSAYNDLKLSV